MASHEADIWMPLDIGKYLGDTMHLTTLQHGAYLLLLMHYWKHGPIQNDPDQIAAICKMDAPSIAWACAWAVLKSYFPLGDDGLLHNLKADKEIAKALENKDKAQKKAKTAAEARWSKQCSKDAPSIPQAMLEQCPSPSPSPKENTPPNPLKEGEPKKRKRRTKQQILEPYSVEVTETVNSLMAMWPQSQPANGQPINFDLAQLAEKIDALIKQGTASSTLLISAKQYLDQTKNYVKAPQWFFGAGNGESAHWTTYARMIVHQQSKAVNQ